MEYAPKLTIRDIGFQISVCSCVALDFESRSAHLRQRLWTFDCPVCPRVVPSFQPFRPDAAWLRPCVVRPWTSSCSAHGPWPLLSARARAPPAPRPLSPAPRAPPAPRDLALRSHPVSRPRPASRLRLAIRPSARTPPRPRVLPLAVSAAAEEFLRSCQRAWAACRKNREGIPYTRASSFYGRVLLLPQVGRPFRRGAPHVSVCHAAGLRAEAHRKARALRRATGTTSANARTGSAGHGG